MEIFEKLPVSVYLSGMQLIDQRSSKNYKHIELFKHNELGKVLVLDGEVQNVEVWAPIYHETIVHLPACYLKEVKTVLILGGGCFFTAIEVLKYSSIERVVMIEIDEQVVKLMLDNFRHPQEILKDSRFKLIIGNAFQEIEKLKEKFDLIINDSIDLLAVRGVKNIFQHLLYWSNDTGICVDMVYRHLFERLTVEKTFASLHTANINYALSMLAIPEYPGVLHLILMWGKNIESMQQLKTSRNLIHNTWAQNGSNIPCEIFNPNYLSYYLYLPPYLKKLIHEG